MPVPTDITAGTISISGSTVTGVGTSFVASDIRQGDLFIWIEGGAGQWSPIVQTVTSNTVLTLAEPWTGPTISGARYRLRYQWDSSRVSAQSRQLIEMLDNGNVLALAGLTGPGVPVFDGPHSMTVRPETDFINGVAYNVQVDTLADRAAYDGQAAGYSVLVSDVGDGRSAVYSKASNASGDWTDPAYITGPIGGTPDIAAGTTTTLPPGSDATFTVGPDGSGGYLLSAGIPAGRGFTNRGAYDSGEDYVIDDVVTFAGSAFIAIQSVPSGNPPSSAMPPVSNAYWEVLAARGANGAGTVSSVTAGSGIAVNPSDPTAPVVALGNVPTATIKGRIAAGTGAPTDLSGTQVNTILPVFGTAKGLVPAASSVQNYFLRDDGTWQAAVDPNMGDLYTNVSLLALSLADLQGSRLGMRGGIADAFDDATGINATSSTGEVYDPSNDWFRPDSTTGTQVDLGAFSSNNSDGSAYTYIDRGTAVLNSVTVYSIGIYSAYSGTFEVGIALRTGTGNYTVVALQAIVHTGSGMEFVSLSSPYAVPASGTYNILTRMNAGNISKTAARSRAYKVGGTSLGAQTGFTEDSGTIPPMAYRHSATTDNMTLISVVYPASAVPASGRMVVQIDTPLTVTPGTDIDAAMSRNGGTNWTTTPLSLVSTVGTVKTYDATAVSLASQPSGSSVAFRIRTLTNKEIPVSGVVMQWGA